MTLKELEEERERLLRELEVKIIDITNIRSQIEHAKIDGVQDPHWLINAECALRHKSRERQRLQFELSRVGREFKAATPPDTQARFIDVARRVLSRDKYAEILSQVSA